MKMNHGHAFELDDGSEIGQGNPPSPDRDGPGVFLDGVCLESGVAGVDPGDPGE